MKMDEYELDLLEAVENADTFERIENFEDELIEAKQAAKNFLNKTKNIRDKARFRVAKILSK